MKRSELKRKAPMKRGTKRLATRTPMKKRNEARIAKLAKLYAARLRRADWKLLRYQAWERSKGLCECEMCRETRKKAMRAYVENIGEVTHTAGLPIEQVDEAFAPVEIHFTSGGGAPHLRFRGGSLHHLTYARLGSERLEDVQFMHKHHHAAVEAQYGTRRRYLNGGSKK